MNTTMHLGGNAAQLCQPVSTSSLPPSSPPFATTLAHLPQPFIAAIPIHPLQPRPSLPLSTISLQMSQSTSSTSVLGNSVGGNATQTTLYY